MKIRRVLLAVAGLFVLCLGLLFGGGATLDDSRRLTTSAVLGAESVDLHRHLTTHQGLVDWWAVAMEAHPDAPPMDVVHVSGPTEGAGLVVGFDAGDVRLETWELLSVSDDEVVWAVDFGLFSTVRTLRIQEVEGGTEVVWDETATFENPASRWFTLMPPEDTVSNFDQALLALEAASQAG